ncbi:MAG: hypothetical protein R3C16_02380 [Hyphomonadaceae bacterium]
MKVWVLAGLFSVATVPFAAAAEVTEDCQLDDSRRGISIQRIDSATASGGGGGQTTAQATPAPTTARPTVATRETVDEEVEREEAERVEAAQRRRNGNRVPDAELIGPRGAL